MELETLIQYASYLLIAIGVMAFLVSAITEVIKAWPGLDTLPTSAVVIVLSLLLCPSCLVALMYWQKLPIEGYMIFACLISAFIVALVAMGGWEKMTEIWNRTRYPYNKD